MTYLTARGRSFLIINSAVCMDKYVITLLSISCSQPSQLIGNGSWKAVDTNCRSVHLVQDVTNGYPIQRSTKKYIILLYSAEASLRFRIHFVHFGKMNLILWYLGNNFSEQFIKRQLILILEFFNFYKINATKKLLNEFNIVESSFCRFCNEEEDQMHLFFYCPYVARLWTKWISLLNLHL